MKISIVTVVYNAADTIACTIESVASQSYPEVEHIVIDGGSSDETMQVISDSVDKLTVVVSEPDKGIYDAMNKGLKLATGDIVGTLNADDFYSDSGCLERVVHEFETKDVDSVFGDLVFVRPDNLNKIVRYYSSENFHPNQFKYGWMPAHPTFFTKRECYEKFGHFKIDYKIAADYELLIRFLYSNGLSYSHLKSVLVKMRTGGVSTRSLKSNWILNKEIVRACHENGINTNMFKVISKYFFKSLQLIKRPN